MDAPRKRIPKQVSAWLRRSAGPVFLLDADGTPVYLNPSCRRWLGFDRDEAIPKDQDVRLAPLALPDEVVAGEAASVRVPAGRQRIVFVPLRAEGGRSLGILGLVVADERGEVVGQAESRRLRDELLDHRRRLQAAAGFDQWLGVGAVHRRIVNQIRAAACSAIPVTIRGEPGTGKRLVARLIHQQGSGSSHPLVPIDCRILPPDVIERELLRPATEGPARRAFQLPEGSTLLLVDFLELPRDLQAGLVEALDGEGNGVRLLATTTDDLDTAVAAERLRPDLHQAMIGLVIGLPPLRTDLENLPLFAQQALELANLRGDSASSHLTAAALRALATYDWPGNRRELARIVDAAHAAAAGRPIHLEHLPRSILGEQGAAYLPRRDEGPGPSLDALLEAYERSLIEKALRASRQNKSKAADRLGISRPRLYRRMQELGFLDAPEAADPDPAGGDG